MASIYFRNYCTTRIVFRMVRAENDEKIPILKYLDRKDIYYIFIATRGY